MTGNDAHQDNNIQEAQTTVFVKSSNMAVSKRVMTAEDLYNFELITGSEISPDGKNVVFSVQWVNKKNEKKFSNLWMTSSRGGHLRQFTFGDWVDSTPKWSPDGKLIAFLSNRKSDKQSQLYIIPLEEGGEAWQLTDMKGHLGAFEWSPDGKKIVCEFTKKDQEELDREKDEQKRKLGVVARHITRAFFKRDGEGFLSKERQHLWTIDTTTGKDKQLTRSDFYDEHNPRWSPNREQILFLSNRAADPDFDPDAVELFVMPANGGEFRKIETPVGEKSGASFSPDGRWIAYFGKDGRGVRWHNSGVWIVPSDGSAAPKNLTAAYDFNVDGSTINDVTGLPHLPAVWSPDGAQIYFQVAYHGDTVLKAVSVNGAVTDIVDDHGAVGLYTFDRQHSTLTFFHADLKDPGQLWSKNLKTGALRKLTHLNENWLRNVDLGAVEETWFTGASGNDLHGWIVKPPKFNEKKTYPSILEIHGGPITQYGNLFMHEFYTLAAQGYVVYFCNPRGGDGYGEAHTQAIWNNWGTVDYDDVMAWADVLAQKAYIDKNRMGVTGGSYGGYMTNWIIGHTTRFEAAVTQRCVSNLISMWGSSDFNWSFQMIFGDKTPWEDDESLLNYWRQSPIKYIKNAKTPTLVIHNESDDRCDIEQGEQVFVALKKLGVETEFVRFPEEPHGLSRVGRTDRRIVRLQHIARWFNRYLAKG